ncbi:MAG TPA: hypothetical protein VGK44_03570 [Casimicrobiaceae bacterium]|jgi:hypothetical protein
MSFHFRHWPRAKATTLELEPLPRTPIRQGHATTGGLVIALIAIALLVIASL